MPDWKLELRILAVALALALILFAPQFLSLFT